MIRKVFKVYDTWKVIVYFDIDYNLFKYPADDLKAIDTSIEHINNIYHTLKDGKAKAVTVTHHGSKVSVVLFIRHNTIEDYINSMIHESEHVKQAILEYFGKDDSGEPPAYLIAEIATKMLVFKAHNRHNS